MTPYNKALAGGVGAAAFQPVGDYLANGFSAEMAHTAFGAFGPDMTSVVAGIITALLTAAAVYLIPNRKALAAASAGK